MFEYCSDKTDFLKFTYDLLRGKVLEIILTKSQHISGQLEPGKAARPFGMTISALTAPLKAVNPPRGNQQVVRSSITLVNFLHPIPGRLPIFEHPARQWILIHPAVVLPMTQCHRQTVWLNEGLKVQMINRSKRAHRVVAKPKPWQVG